MPLNHSKEAPTNASATIAFCRSASSVIPVSISFTCLSGFPSSFRSNIFDHRPPKLELGSRPTSRCSWRTPTPLSSKRSSDSLPTFEHSHRFRTLWIVGWEEKHGGSARSDSNSQEADGRTYITSQVHITSRDKFAHTHGASGDSACSVFWKWPRKHGRNSCEIGS